jgi:hypothetical protein
MFLRDSYVCQRWTFIFDSDQAQINSEGKDKVREEDRMVKKKEYSDRHLIPRDIDQNMANKEDIF